MLQNVVAVAIFIIFPLGRTYYLSKYPVHVKICWIQLQSFAVSSGL